MLKIIAIGGGGIGDDGAKPEVLSISLEIIRLSGKRNPKFLFLPTAALDDENYIKAVKNHFGRDLKCRLETLCLIKQKPEMAERKGKILAADIIYVGGGNTLLMMNRWRKLGVDKLLLLAAKKGKVLCGPSAGAICWFRQGNSDSRKFRNPKAKLIKVTGLGFIDALACPHYDVEKDRKPELKEMMKNTKGFAVAIDNCAALEVAGNKYRILASKPKAGVYSVFWRSGKFHEHKYEGTAKWFLLSKLLDSKKDDL